MGNFTNNDLDEMRKEINDVLKRYGDTKGVSFKLGRISYSDSYFSTKMEVFKTSPNNDGMKEQFVSNGRKFRVPADWYGKVVKLNDGLLYKVVGVNTRARKYPINLVPVNGVGQGKKSSVEHIRSLIVWQKKYILV